MGAKGYGASQCGSLNNALNPTLGLKNSLIALIFRYIPLHTLGANHYYKGGNQKTSRFLISMDQGIDCDPTNEFIINRLRQNK